MSDFIFSNKSNLTNKLSLYINDVYEVISSDVEIRKFCGDWGSFVINRNLYNGFEPYETEKHICAVIGGPVLTFCSNSFIADGDSSEGTKAIYTRWIKKKCIEWDTDLSGPFIVILIDKKEGRLQVISDIMSFLPVYAFRNDNEIVVGSHADMVAKASGVDEDIDYVSVIDFILNGVVTYPFTFYKEVEQLKPASRNTWNTYYPYEFVVDNYWYPYEKVKYSSISNSGKFLRGVLHDYLNRITESVPRVATFISGGEDSRTVLASIPEHCEIDAFIFLDKMNREGRIAKKASELYKADFHLATRSSTSYLDILPMSSKLIGSGYEYKHAHTFELFRSCNLDKYPVVLGGLLSDALLKGSRIHAKKVVPLPFLPERSYPDDRIGRLEHDYVSNSVLKQINERRNKHLDFVKEYRDESFDEWFHLWPISMNRVMAYLYCNRRLFRSYEPFMANDVVKVSASVPQSFKLNRRLFHSLAKPLLKESKYLIHTSGRIPYFSWHINDILKPIIRRFLTEEGYPGPWTDWDILLEHDKAKEMVTSHQSSFDKIKGHLKYNSLEQAFSSNHVSSIQKLSLLQVCFFLNKD